MIQYTRLGKWNLILYFECWSDLFEKQHWLPIKHQIIFKNLLLQLKFFTKYCPLYINNCFTILDNENRTRNRKV